MANRRITRSNTNARREPRESEAQYRSSIPDPSRIERDQAEALRMTRYATGATNQDTTEEMGAEPQSYLTNYTENSTTTASHILQTVFVSEDEMQAVVSLKEREMEQVVTPVESNEPPHLMYIQPTPRLDDDLDVQPSRGLRDPGNVTEDIVDNYFEENLTDVLKNSGLGSNFSEYLQQNKDRNMMVHPTQQPNMALEWNVLDSINRQLVNIKEKSVANFNSPGGGMGAMLVTLPQLTPFYETDCFLVDLDTGELFVRVKAQWRCTGLYCMDKPFEVEKIWKSIEHNCATVKRDLEWEEQTSVVRVQTPQGDSHRRRAQLPSLPLMGNPEIYINYPDAMPLLTRRNYVRDRTQSALTYILEYGQTKAMLEEGIYDEQEVHQRFHAVFGRVNAIRRKIDEALENDYMHRRRREMHVLPSPRNFPQPQSMEQSSVPT